MNPANEQTRQQTKPTKLQQLQALTEATANGQFTPGDVCAKAFPSSIREPNCCSLTIGTQDAHNLVASDQSGQADSVRVTQDNTDLGRGQTLAGQLADHVRDLLAARLEPGGGTAAIGDGRARDTLSTKGLISLRDGCLPRSVHTTHFASLIQKSEGGSEKFASRPGSQPFYIISL